MMFRLALRTLHTRFLFQKTVKLGSEIGFAGIRTMPETPVGSLLSRSSARTDKGFQLEILGNGFWGMVYEANVERVIPVGTRLAGFGFAFIVLGIHIACWGGFWLVVFAFPRLLRKSNPITTPAPSI
jgi:hypothetical protein